MSEPLRISLWSGPRNVSTALMYSFRQRSDTEVVDEPLYGHYLAVAGVVHPAHHDVLDAMDTNGERVVRQVILGPSTSSVRFFKNMAHHIVGLDLGFLDRLTNVLLTREPKAMLRSLTHQVPDVDLAGTGLPDQVRILDHILAGGTEPIVLESSELLRDPRYVLTESCRRMGIPFDERMLSWPPGSKPEDGVWAPHWYASVHRSTGFAPPDLREHAFPEQLVLLLEQCLPLYERLAAHAIRVPEPRT